MKYILNENIALRSWHMVPYAYYIRHMRNAAGLTEAEYEFLSACDGATEAPAGSEELAEKFLASGMIREAKDGEAVSQWSRPRYCDNRYFPALNLMLTGKCNYNCLHCFNAADNAPLMSEFSFEEALSLLDEAKLCGINAFTITGGEPMLHRNFFEIIEGIYERGMYVEELNTNGFLLNQEALDRFKDIDCYPLIKISFDGTGHHDWLRNRAGAEADALRAIKLCVENGFRVKVQTNVHRKNLESMMPTALLMEKLGVAELRIIRTTEAPRWVQNGGEYTLNLSEYFDAMLDLVSEYKEKIKNMSLDIWQFADLFPQSRSFRMRPVECAEGEYRDSIPVCRGNRGMVAVGADGSVYPCHQLSGEYERRNEHLGNVKTEGLQSLLRESRYLSEVCTTAGELKSVNSRCASCRYFRYCAGGCRAVALVLTDDKLGCDPSKCMFFESGYHRRITEIMGEWRNLAPVSEEL